MKLYAGSSETYSQNTPCNDDKFFYNEGAVNCVVSNAKYLHLVTDASVRYTFNQIFIFEQPDSAQVYLTSSSSTGTFVSGDASYPIGTVDDVNSSYFKAKISFGSSGGSFQIDTSKVLPSSVVFIM